MERVIIVRYGELGLKGKNRPVFEDALKRGLQQAVRLSGTPARVVKTFGRFFVEPRDEQPLEMEALLPMVQRVFGLVSISPAIRVPATLEQLRTAAATALAEHLAAHRDLPEPIPFRVETHRADKLFPLSSQETNMELGGFLLDREPRLKVNLSAPRLTVHVEIREGKGYLYTEVLPGPGGLPYGSSGRGLLLLSGGIDSPVAGWMMMKRGVRLEAIHFESPPFTSERAREKVIDLCKVLAAWGEPIKLHIISTTEIQKQIRMQAPEDLSITLLRRFMLRISEGVARKAGAGALITGDSLGQVASQTMESIETINAVTAFPVLRPAIALDKAEIIDLAHRVGTYELSILPFEDCCTLFAPRNPRTRPRPEQAAAAEERLPVAELVAQALAADRVLLVGPDQVREWRTDAAPGIRGIYN